MQPWENILCKSGKNDVKIMMIPGVRLTGSNETILDTLLELKAKSRGVYRGGAIGPI